MTIGQLGYLGFRVSRIDAWEAFLGRGLGLMQGEASPRGPRFRADELAWRIALEPGPEDDLAFVGFEVADAAALDVVRRRLAEAGVRIGNDDPALRQERGVMGLVTCQDPDGLRVEIFYGPTLRRELPFASSTATGGFVTGDQGLGHIVLMSPDVEALRRFYVELLGFRLSDIICMKVSPDSALEVEFYHCNGRHHTLALVPVPSPKRLHHFLLQVSSLDDVGVAMERMASVDAPLTQTLGRHTNDQMVSFYVGTPSGFEVEVGWGAIDVDDATWRVSRHDRTSIWGHKRIAPHG